MQTCLTRGRISPDTASAGIQYTSAMNVTDDVKHDVRLRSLHDTKLPVCLLIMQETSRLRTTHVRFVFAPLSLLLLQRDSFPISVKRSRKYKS